MAWEKTVTSLAVELFLATSGLLKAILTIYITCSSTWSANNDIITEASVLYGPSAGLFYRCYSRFSSEFTCDDYIEPFWTLPGPLIFCRVGMIISCICIVVSFFLLVLSMNCVFYGEIPGTFKQKLQVISLILRIISVILTAIVVSTYVIGIAKLDKRGRFDASVVDQKAFPFRYGVYQLVAKSVYIGWSVAGTDAIVCTYWTVILCKPSAHAQDNYRIGRTKLPFYYEEKRMAERRKRNERDKLIFVNKEIYRKGLGPANGPGPYLV